MSRFIELCGAPGSGKSTSYHLLKSRWKKGDVWMPTEYPQKELEYTGLKPFFLSAWKCLRRARDLQKLDEAGERFVSEYAQYMDKFWSSNFFQNWPEYTGVDIRFRNVNVFWNTLRKVQYIRESERPEIVISNEGLIQRIGNGWYKGRTLADDIKEAKELIETMPLPQAVIYLQVDVHENVTRIETRKKMLPAHKLLSAQELKKVTKNNQERWNCVCNLLEEKNIPVLRLDSGASAGINVEKIIAFAEDVHRDSALHLEVQTNLEQIKG